MINNPPEDAIMKRRTVLMLATTTLVVIIAGVLAARPPAAPENVTEVSEPPPLAKYPAGMTQSSDRVHLQLGPGADDQELVVTLNIDDGWHVNANPASLDFLIPTTVSTRIAGQPVATPAAYPPGKSSGISLQDTDIKVYDDDTEIRLQLDPTVIDQLDQGAPLTVSVRVQSCNDTGICLAPSDLIATVNR